MSARPPIQPQCVPLLLCSTANGSEDTTLIDTVNLTDAYRAANLTGNQVKLPQWTNGAFVTLRSQVDGDTGTLELWGYPAGGDAQFLGIHTYTTDLAVAADGYFYVDAFVLGTAAQHTVTIQNMANGIATLKFDTLGFKYIVGLVTAITSEDADGIAKVHLRPW